MRHGMDGRGGDDTVVTDMLKGAVAGAVGVFAMDRVDWLMYGLGGPEARRRTEAARPGGRDPAHVVAGMAARAAGVELSSPRQNPAGLAVHYGLGVMPGAAYGALRDRLAYVGAGRGSVWGLGLFLLQDEALNALLGLSGPPGRYPWQAHARGLLAHVVYGVVTDLVLDVLQRRSEHDRDRDLARRHWPA